MLYLVRCVRASSSTGARMYHSYVCAVVAGGSVQRVSRAAGTGRAAAPSQRVGSTSLQSVAGGAPVVASTAPGTPSALAAPVATLPEDSHALPPVIAPAPAPQLAASTSRTSVVGGALADVQGPSGALAPAPAQPDVVAVALAEPAAEPAAAAAEPAAAAAEPAAAAAQPAAAAAEPAAPAITAPLHDMHASQHNVNLNTYAYDPSSLAPDLQAHIRTIQPQVRIAWWRC